MDKLRALGFTQPSKTHLFSGLLYFSYFFLLSLLLMSREAAALFEFPYVLLLVIPYFFLATNSPVVGLGIYVIYFATGFKSLAPSYGGFLTLSTLLNMGLVIALAMHLVRHRTISALKNTLSLLVFLYIGLFLASALLRRNLYEGGNVSVKTAVLIGLLYVCIVLFLNSQDRMLQMLRMLIFLAFAWAGLSIYHVLRFGVQGLYTRAGAEGGYLEQIVDVNSLAVSVLMVLPLLYVQVNLKQRPVWRVLAVASVLLSVVTVILTFSRNGFISLIVVMGLILLRNRRSSRVWVLLGLLLLVMIITPSQYWARVLSTSGVDTYQLSMSRGITAKLSYVQEGLGRILRNPVFGIGTGRLERSIHNSIVQVAVEMGLGVLFLYLAILAGAIRWLRKMWTSPGPGGIRSELPYMMMVGLVAYVIGGLTISIQWYFPLFMMLGLVSAYEAIQEKTPQGAWADVT